MKKLTRPVYRGKIILIDAMSAPGTGHFYVMDVKTGQQKFKDSHYDQGLDLDASTLTYYTFSKKLDESCPKEANVGSGCEEIQKVALNLKTFEKKLLKVKKVIPIQ